MTDDRHHNPSVPARSDWQPWSDRALVDLYYYSARLTDLQHMQVAGARLPGGIGGRIQTVALSWSSVQDRALDLVDTDPDYARELALELKHSGDANLSGLSKAITERLKRTQ